MQLRRLTGHNEKDDWVFCGNDGKQAKGFYKTLPEMLTQAKLLLDKNGDRRSVYSFRHYYAEHTLREMRYTENAIDMLCKNMDTSRRSIDNHYVRRGVISNKEDLLQATDAQKEAGQGLLAMLRKNKLVK